MINKKIALVGFRLNTGGSERVMANLSNFFHDEGLEVHIIIFHDDLGYNFSGTIFNLGKYKSQSNTIFNKIKRFYYLNNYIKKHQFDFIIDFRFRINIIQELLINKWIYKAKTIYTVHSSQLYYYMPNYTPLTKLIYGLSYSIVSITKEMQRMIEEKHGLKNVITIYNPINIKQIEKEANEYLNMGFEYIISVGHFNTNQKQFDKLILAYSKSILPRKNIKLVLLGDGDKKSELIKIAQFNNIDNMICFLGFKTNPFKYIKQSKFYVMTSLHEGLPMVLLESLASGTPVISFDCPTGPSEIIQHKINGLLIENQNFEAFIKAMNEMLIDKDLYSICKKNAKESAKKFSLETIGMQWLELMKYN
ncbi:glycosyltransferase [Gaetbulibacter sp. M235]|uniref:glycosyltransferase n=1 Tax=Gaetbulibacter sp. M235 TaxID=3126510 RepID=UPI00374FC36A